MLRVTDDVKLDFDDVLIVPQPSDLNSRSEVSLERKICMPNAKMINPYEWDRRVEYAKDFFDNRPKVCWQGTPVICANMDTVGTMEMAKKFAEEKMLVALHKHHSEEQLVEFFVDNKELWTNIFYTVGSGKEDYEKLQRVRETINERMYFNACIESHMFPRMICLDIANGYSKHFCEAVKRYRETYPWAIIMAGNVVTGNMAEKLIEYGADIVKVGIGPGAVCTTRLKTGCFVSGTKVNTEDGFVNIENIKEGQKVLTHDGTYKSVVKSQRLEEEGYLININGVTCTRDHRFYVVNKEQADEINDENIHEYAYWLEADNISDNHLIIEIEE